MKKQRFWFAQEAADFYFDASFSQLSTLTDPRATVIVTDQQVYKHHRAAFAGWNTIVLRTGESFKVQQTIDALIEQLIALKADRSTTLVGVGGGVVTDITGYTAAIFMRGIRLGLVPTSLLAMVDAAVGGKNGVNVGLYKNAVGTIRQPAFLLYDKNWLSTLPLSEWKNGFAEIIKHAAILDKRLFAQLEKNDIAFYREHPKALQQLLVRNVRLKVGVVQQDEKENDLRRILNFGHTLGHALENQYELSHGQAIALGMMTAAQLSHRLIGFDQAERLERLLQRYGLPTAARYDVDKALAALRMDKKKKADTLRFILLQAIGKALVHPIAFRQLEQQIRSIACK